MDLRIGLLVGTVFAFTACQLLSAQEYAVEFDAPFVAPIAVAAPSVAVQTFTMESNGAPVTVNVPFVMDGYLGGYSSGYSNGHLNYLHDPSVMKDLELVDDQVDKLADIRKEFQKRVRDEWKQIAKAKKENDTDRAKELQQGLSDLHSEQQEELSSVLLPHQLDRIKQVSHQMQMQMFGGASGALQHGQLAKAMDITDEQKKELAAIQKKMNADIAAKTKELQNSAKKQAMEILTEEQKTKFKELTGEEFKRNPTDWQERRQRTLTRRKKD